MAECWRQRLGLISTERFLCFCVAFDVDLDYDLSIDDRQRLGLILR